MQIGEAVRMARGTLQAHKMRSILTALGVIIGVSSVIGLLAIVTGIRASVSRQFSSLGANMISINRFPWGMDGGGDEDFSKRKPISMRDYNAVRALPAVDVASPTVYTVREVSFRGTHLTGVMVCGTDDVYPAIEDWKVAQGRFLAADDVLGAQAVAVLGFDVAATLFPDGGALDQEIRVGGHVYRVVGTLEKKGSIFGQSQDRVLDVPYTTFSKHWGIGQRRDVNISALAAPGVPMQDAIDEIRGALRRSRRVAEGAKDDFAINTSDALIQQFNGITQGFFGVMVMIGGMSLLVGGIGIMNIMLVSVTERTREVGLRKALGARRRDLVRQFLIEAVILCLAGGAVGVALGWGIGFAVAKFSPLPASVSWWSVVLGFGVSTVVGVVFGLYPAVRASRLDPVVALRSE
jgi:putative ABC transport system permease protein